MLHRFLLTILPSPALSEKVIAMRAALYARIGSFSGRNTLPHITLCFLDLPETSGPAIMEAIANGAPNQPGFTLRYNGITHFPDKRTIYIDPVEKQAIAAVRAPIIAALQDHDALRTAVRETDHPHLTIAAGLKPDKFVCSSPLISRTRLWPQNHKPCTHEREEEVQQGRESADRT